MLQKIIRDFIIVSLVVGLIGFDRITFFDNPDELKKQAKEEIINENKDLPPKEFRTDGCTLWPDGIFRYSWQEECVEHDIQYWAGGTEEERLQADLKLREGVNNVLPGMGDIVYLGVRAGGISLNSLIPWPWGWGYGWNGTGATTTATTTDNNLK